jgi:transmembrane protein TMEM260 (protein O-mannosyltransferase)
VASSPIDLGPRDGSPWISSIILAAAMFGCYLWLAPPVSGDKDASEFVLALSTGGVIHPTGYPIYTLVGQGFVALLHRLGVGFPFAANTWAALGGGVAMLFYHRLALRMLPPRGPSPIGRFVLAALPVLVLGFNPVWLVECTVVEVHSWHVAWLCGTTLFFVGLVDELERGRAPIPHLPRRMVAWGLLCGLGGAHHTTAIFFAGGLTLALIWALARGKQLRAWVPMTWLAAGVLPLLSYGYIYYRANHPGDAQVWPALDTSFRGTFDHLTARDYRSYLGRFAPDGAQAAWLRWYIHPYLWAGLALFAFDALPSRGFPRRLVTGGLIFSAIAQTLFAFRYGVGDPDAYFLPALLVALLSIAAAGGRALLLLERTRFGTTVAAAATAIALVAFMVLCMRVAVGRKNALVELDRHIHSYWNEIPHDRAIVLWPDDIYYRLKEYQTLRGEKPGLDVYNTANLFQENGRTRFRRKHGFDPLGAMDDAHRRQPLKPEFVIGQQRSAGDAHAFAVVHEHIAQTADVPVIAFELAVPPRALTPALAPRPSSLR